MKSNLSAHRQNTSNSASHHIRDQTTNGVNRQRQRLTRTFAQGQRETIVSPSGELSYTETFYTPAETDAIHAPEQECFSYPDKHTQTENHSLSFEAVHIEPDTQSVEDVPATATRHKQQQARKFQSQSNVKPAESFSVFIKNRTIPNQTTDRTEKHFPAPLRQEDAAASTLQFSNVQEIFRTAPTRDSTPAEPITEDNSRHKQQVRKQIEQHRSDQSHRVEQSSAPAVQSDPQRMQNSSLQSEPSTTTLFSASSEPTSKLQHEPENPQARLTEDKPTVSRLRFDKANATDTNGTASKHDTTKAQRQKPKRQKQTSQQGKATSSTLSKPKSRLQFTKEELSAPVQTVSNAVLVAGASVVHGELNDAEQDNVAVEAVHKSALSVQRTTRLVRPATSNRTLQRSKHDSLKAQTLHHSEQRAEKFQFTKSARKDTSQAQSKSERKQLIKHIRKKKQVQEGYQAIKYGTKASHSLRETASNLLQQLFGTIAEKKHGIFTFFFALFLLLFFMTQFSSCGTMLAGVADAFLRTTWLSEDEDITDAEVYYTQLEAQLQRKINRTETTYSGYDEYEYDLDDIGHDPSALISYLSMISENGIFTFDSATKSKLDSIFEEQYTLTISHHTETKTHTKTVRVGESLGQVVTSAYCACSLCCGSWAGSPTASGVYPTEHHTLAVDKYNPIVPMGTQIVMNGTLYKVEDTGNLNYHGVNFDVFFENHTVAQAWGHKTFEAYLYDANGSESITVTTTEQVNVCTVRLRKKSLDRIAVNYLNVTELAQYYLYKESSGNRAFLPSPVDMSWQEHTQLYGYRCSSSNALTMHEGLDLELYTNAPVYSVLDGIVTEIGQNATLGKYLVIQNDKGYWVKLAHLNAYAVITGQTVTKGDLVGRIGSTGNVSRGTLHIELKHNGIAYDPYFYLRNGSG